jgi:uncharacterized protein involved in type VI secretion and phage assembly
VSVFSGFDGPPADDLAEQSRQLFYGKYRGIVAEVDAATCRIKATVPAVLGDVSTGWCLPCVPYAGRGVGIVFLPEPGSGVWIEFEGGDVSFPVWVGGYWREGEPPPEVAPDVKVIATAGPHKLVFNDAAKSITITDPNGSTVTLNEAGITLSRGGQQVLISEASVSVNDGALEVQ